MVVPNPDPRYNPMDPEDESCVRGPEEPSSVRDLDFNDIARQIQKLVNERGVIDSSKQYPRAIYNKYGDQIEVLFSEEESYAQWKNSQITLIRSQKTDEVIGVTICGISKLLEKDD